MDRFTIAVVVFALVGYKRGVVEAEDCNGPYTGNTQRKPTPLDFGFKYVGNQKFEKQCYNHDNMQIKVVMSFSPDGYAEFEVDGEPYPMTEYRTYLTVHDQGAKSIDLQPRGWYVPQECAKGERKAITPEELGFQHEGDGVYVRRYRNADNEEDTIKMRITRKNQAWFTYHPIRDYFPLEHVGGKIEIPEASGNKPIPFTGVESGDHPSYLEPYSAHDYKYMLYFTDNSGDRSNGYKFQSLGDGIYEKEFTTIDGTVETIRMRFDEKGLAEWNFNESKNIQETDDGSLLLKLQDGKIQKLQPYGWDKINQWYIPGYDPRQASQQSGYRSSSRYNTPPRPGTKKSGSGWFGRRH